MKNENKNLLNAMTPRPLPTQKQYEQEQAELGGKPRYFVVDQFGVERQLPPNFLPANEEQIRYIVRARNITIIRKHGNSVKTFMPQSAINLQAVIINSLELLHQQHDWISIDMIQQHLDSLQIEKTDDEIQNELRSIYALAKTKKNKVECHHRTNLDGDNEFQIRLIE